MFQSLFLQTEEYKKLAGALSGKGACALFGLPASGRALVYAALGRALLEGYEAGHPQIAQLLARG